MTKFEIDFDFEKKLIDSSINLINKKIFYDSKPIVYPFNDLKGTY